MNEMKASAKGLCIAVLLSTLFGCATVDFDYPKPESRAPTDTHETTLGSYLHGLADEHPGEAGFYPIGDGIEALSIRLLLAARAEVSIDAQYYLIKNDVVGNAFINVLLNAADRGVRVRLLVDDVFTGGYDAALASLDAHPNFEIRISIPSRAAQPASWMA